MKWSLFGRAAMALTSAVALGLSMTACGGYTVAYLWSVGTTSATTTGSASTSSGTVVGYLVDNYTGNLTAIPGQPFASGGTNPVQVLVRPGGRFVYVINQGAGYSTTGPGTSDAIQLFAVGGTGTLTPEQPYETQGYGHVWATFDSTGSYLYVLDKYSPATFDASGKLISPSDGFGIITTFSSDPTTGRLNLVQQTASTQPGQSAPTFLRVGQTPIQMASTGGCLFTVNAVGQNVTAYSIANGQLGTVTTGTIPLNTVSASSIAGNGQYMFVTDTQNGANQGYITPYNVGAGCSLTPFTGGVQKNTATAVNPINTFLSTSGKYLYVLNQFSGNTTSNTRTSSLTAYVINSGLLQEISNSPFSTGAGPTCMVEDPTSKYLYVSGGLDGSITGYLYSDTTGQLGNLQRGSRFQTANQTLSCLAISGAV